VGGLQLTSSANQSYYKKHMKIIRYNVSKPKKYSDRSGVEKTQWNNIGIMTEFHKDDGTIGRIIEIPAIGLDANIFEIVPKDKGSQAVDSPEDTDDIL